MSQHIGKRWGMRQKTDTESTLGLIMGCLRLIFSIIKYKSTNMWKITSSATNSYQQASPFWTRPSHRIHVTDSHNQSTASVIKTWVRFNVVFWIKCHKFKNIKPSLCCIVCFKTHFEPHSNSKRMIKALQKLIDRNYELRGAGPTQWTNIIIKILNGNNWKKQVSKEDNK